MIYKMHARARRDIAIFAILIAVLTGCAMLAGCVGSPQESGGGAGDIATASSFPITTPGAVLTEGAAGGELASGSDAAALAATSSGAYVSPAAASEQSGEGTSEVQTSKAAGASTDSANEAGGTKATSSSSTGQGKAAGASDAKAASGKDTPAGKSDSATKSKPATGSSSRPAQKPAAKPTPSAELITVSIAADCLTLQTENPDMAAKVSKNGIILAKKNVAVQAGASVYDVLKQSKVAFAGKAYISSIGGLSEGDGGGKSGWLYSVNGIYPGKGIMAYTVSAGDSIAFRYTMDGGADVR